MKCILVCICLVAITSCSALASEQENFSINAADFLSDYVSFLYEVKKVEGPDLARKLADASRSKSEETFITAWIQYSHRFEEALTFIRPHATSSEADIREISTPLIMHLDYITSGISRIISLIISDGAESEAVKKEIKQLSKRTKLFFGQLQLSAVEIVGMIKERKLSYKQLKMIDSEINLFIGNELLEIEEIGLENLLFGEAGRHIALPHYMWAAIFIKAYIDKSIDAYEADKIIGE